MTQPRRDSWASEFTPAQPSASSSPASGYGQRPVREIVAPTPPPPPSRDALNVEDTRSGIVSRAHDDRIADRGAARADAQFANDVGQQQFGRINSLVTQFQQDPEIRQFGTLRTAFEGLEALQSQQGNPFAAIGTIYNFMKSLDPGSTVREGEYATAQNAGGIPDSLRNAYNSAIGNGRLNPDQYRQIMDVARSTYNPHALYYNQTATRYQELLRRMGVGEDEIPLHIPTVRAFVNIDTSPTAMAEGRQMQAEHAPPGEQGQPIQPQPGQAAQMSPLAAAMVDNRAFPENPAQSVSDNQAQFRTVFDPVQRGHAMRLQAMLNSRNVSGEQILSFAREHFGENIGNVEALVHDRARHPGKQFRIQDMRQWASHQEERTPNERAMGAFIDSAPGTGVLNFSNALTAGTLPYVAQAVGGGDVRDIQAGIRGASARNPISAVIGDTAGNVAAYAMGSRIPGVSALGRGLSPVARAGAGDVIYGGIRGAAENPDDPLAGAVVGATTQGVAGLAGQGVGAAISPVVSRSAPTMANLTDRVMSALRPGLRPEGEAAVRAAQAEGVPVSTPIVNPLTRDRMAVYDSMPGTGNVVRDSLENTRQGIERAVGEISTRGENRVPGQVREMGAMGQTIQDAGDRFIARSNARTHELYDRAARLAGDPQFEARNMAETLQSEMQTLARNGNQNAPEMALLQRYMDDIVRPASAPSQSGRSVEAATSDGLGTMGRQQYNRQHGDMWHMPLDHLDSLYAQAKASEMDQLRQAVHSIGFEPSPSLSRRLSNQDANWDRVAAQIEREAAAAGKTIPPEADRMLNPRWDDAPLSSLPMSEDIDEIRKAISAVSDNDPHAVASEVGWAMRSLDTDSIARVTAGEGSPTEQARMAAVRLGVQRLAELGTPQNAVPAAIVDAMVRNGVSRDQAVELTESALASMRDAGSTRAAGNSPGIQAAQITDASATPPPPAEQEYVPKSIQDMRDMRTGLRSRLDQAGLTNSPVEARLLRAIDAASQDVEAVLANNPRAMQAYRNADRYTASRHEQIREIVSKIIGRDNNRRSGAEAMSTVRDWFSGRDLNRARMLYNGLDSAEQADLAATIAHATGRLGENGEFSAARFLSQTNKVPTSSLTALYGPAGARSVENLRILARESEGAWSRINRTNSGRVANYRFALRDMLLGGSAGTGGALIGTLAGGLPGGVAGLAVGGAMGLSGAAVRGLRARALMSPDMSRWIGRATRATTPAQVQSVIRDLARIATRDTAIRTDVLGLQSALSSAIGDDTLEYRNRTSVR